MTGGPFRATNMGTSLWIGDTEIGMREGSSWLTGIVYDREALVEGAPIGISDNMGGSPLYMPITLHLDTPPSP